MFPTIRNCILLLLFSQSALAALQLPSYYPKEFQNKVDDGLKDEPLKQELHLVLSMAHLVSNSGDTLTSDCGSATNCIWHKNLGYDTARRIMFGKIHLESDGNGYFVNDLYCQKAYYESEFRKSPPGPDQIPDPNILNTEHSWPQSKFSHNFPKDLQKSDLNILFPVSKKSNSMRSNLPLGEVQEIDATPCPLAKRGSTAERDGAYFEPPDEQKGASARAILYFSIRYKKNIDSTQEQYLREWNRRFPVNNMERSRNEQIYEVQGNRNPFVDAPELADMISDF